MLLREEKIETEGTPGRREGKIPRVIFPPRVIEARPTEGRASPESNDTGAMLTQKAPIARDIEPRYAVKSVLQLGENGLPEAANCKQVFRRALFTRRLKGASEAMTPAMMYMARACYRIMVIHFSTQVPIKHRTISGVLNGHARKYESGFGSGFHIGDGLVITNFHVLQSAAQPYVQGTRKIWLLRGPGILGINSFDKAIEVEAIDIPEETAAALQIDRRILRSGVSHVPSPALKFDYDDGKDLVLLRPINRAEHLKVKSARVSVSLSVPRAGQSAYILGINGAPTPRDREKLYPKCPQELFDEITESLCSEKLSLTSGPAIGTDYQNAYADFIISCGSWSGSSGSMAFYKDDEGHFRVFGVKRGSYLSERAESKELLGSAGAQVISWQNYNARTFLQAVAERYLSSDIAAEILEGLKK